ncbi:MAG: hypothetical protein GY694_13780 [Gammaproteobacteria bacterium]|nr:hypothetical protein [Gammaproteobacteria bacterium]
MEVLSKLNGAKTTSAIVAFVLENHGTLFPTQKLADKFVKELIDKYGL